MATKTTTTSAHRAHLSKVMTLAWGLYRDGGRTFSQALRGAWKFIRNCAKLPKVGSYRFGDVLPRRSAGGGNVGGRFSANYLTARVGG